MGSLYAGQRRQQAWHVIQEAVDQKLGQIARLPDYFKQLAHLRQVKRAPLRQLRILSQPRVEIG